MRLVVSKILRFICDRLDFKARQSLSGRCVFQFENVRVSRDYSQYISILEYPKVGFNGKQEAPLVNWFYVLSPEH